MMTAYQARSTGGGGGVGGGETSGGSGGGFRGGGNNNNNNNGKGGNNNNSFGGSKNETFLYQKVGPNGEHLKYGITRNPNTRYTEAQLNGGKLRIIASGNRQEMLKLERNLYETLPIGSEERQNFYIRKQVEKGLNPPPYRK